ncbi:MAG: hypothetical protein EXR98_09580 [Gemmataceae bacterium]|nr:hypothetical protein [Gemmataceae bacterium]
MKLSGRLVAAADLSAEQRDAMFALMDRHFVNVQRPIFEADLDDKHWVILLADAGTGRLCGFSTQRLLEVEVEGRPIKALFSGDTIIDREYWGDQALIHVWGGLALSLIDTHPEAELYWFLISQGYKTYRFLPIFFREFYPQHDVAAPAWVRPVIDFLARPRYPETYDADAGVIRATASQYRLRAGVADITDERLSDPHIRFFQSRNPDHTLGDELCCLAPLTRANFTRAAYRIMGRAPAALEVT